MQVLGIADTMGIILMAEIVYRFFREGKKQQKQKKERK
jgi:hypothetical protein